MGKIKEFIESRFKEHRENRITLQRLIMDLCDYAHHNVVWSSNFNLFIKELVYEFDEEGNIKQ